MVGVWNVLVAAVINKIVFLSGRRVTHSDSTDLRDVHGRR